MLGRMNGGGDVGPAPACIAPLAATSISSDGAGWAAGDAAGAANEGPPAMAKANTTPGATAPRALLLFCTPPPRSCSLMWQA